MPRCHYRSYKGITLLARNLRKHLTPSEKILWALLRRRKICGYKFLRQHPVIYQVDKGWVDFYIPDFYCSELKLIIEVDGPVHDDQVEYDNERDLKLLKKGIHVIRFKNEELENLEFFLKRIEEIVAQSEMQIIESKSN